jgi:hypothetical protein
VAAEKTCSLELGSYLPSLFIPKRWTIGFQTKEKFAVAGTSIDEQQTHNLLTCKLRIL